MAEKSAIEHRINTTRGKASWDLPLGSSYEEMKRFWDRIRDCSVKRSKRRIAIMSMLATGWLPWGIKCAEEGEAPNLPLCGNEYIMSCGHVMEPKEAQAFVDSGLLMAGERDRLGRPTLVITQAGHSWLSQNW